MTQIFANRAELMPMGETTDEHQKWQQEEAALVEKDRSDTGPAGGLFRGCFKRRIIGPRYPMGYMPRQPIRDAEDGVDRCPRCTWELEDGLCQSCGYPSGDEDLTDSDAPEYYPPFDMYPDENLTEEAVLDALDHAGHPDGFDGEYSPASLSEEDYMNEGELQAIRNARHGHSLLGPRPWSPYPDEDRTPYDTVDEGTDENSEEEDEEGGSLDGFVVDDDGEGRHLPTTSSQSLLWETDEETGDDDHHTQVFGEESEMERGNHSDQESMQYPPSVAFASDEDSDEDPIPPSRRRIPPRVTNLNSSSSDEGDDRIRAIAKTMNRRTMTQNSPPEKSNGTIQPQRNIPHHARAANSNGGRSHGVPIEIDSDSDVPVSASQHIRRRHGQRSGAAEEGSGPEDSSGTATVGRMSQRSTPPRKEMTWQDALDRHKASQVAVESSRRPFAGNGYQLSSNEQTPPPFANFGEPSRFSELTFSNWNQPANDRQWPARTSPSANQGTLDSPRSASDQNQSSTSPNETRRASANHRLSPLPPPRWSRHSPAPGSSRPATNEENFQQGVRDRQAQKAERKADRRRMKAERERRRSADAARSASPPRLMTSGH